MYFLYSVYSYLSQPPFLPRTFSISFFPFPGKSKGLNFPTQNWFFLKIKKISPKLLFLSTRLPRIPLYMKCMSLREGGGRRERGTSSELWQFCFSLSGAGGPKEIHIAVQNITFHVMIINHWLIPFYMRAGNTNPRSFLRLRRKNNKLDKCSILAFDFIKRDQAYHQKEIPPLRAYRHKTGLLYQNYHIFYQRYDMPTFEAEWKYECVDTFFFLLYWSVMVQNQNEKYSAQGYLQRLSKRLWGVTAEIYCI